jgi:hypothetical protein
MTDQSFTVCQACREPLDPDAPDAIKAVEVVPVPGFGAAHDTADGIGVLFHADCFPEGHPGYRRV